MIYVETPTNPTMNVTDIAAIARIASARNATLVVDNTFLSPYLQSPLELGAQIVVHSMTKYLNGHSDAVGGSVILARPADAEKIYFLQRSTGAGLAPMDCFLVSRGIKTLAVRMKQHDANGRAVARFLEDHPSVKHVFYPGLPSHPQHEVALRQQRGFGAMISFDVATMQNARAVLNSLKLCSLAESLGGVETLISHPATMTHSSVPPEVRQRIGITEGLIRISVGIEDVEDLIDDLDQALQKI
jgi:cystathionine beta-lyase/cystathionine gamma-synthase